MSAPTSTPGTPKIGTAKLPGAFGLEPVDVHRLTERVADADVVVVGSGIAGLEAALELAPRRVTLLTKTTLHRGGSSSWAQGGVAAALHHDDSPADHADDTLVAGAELNDRRAVEVLTSEGPMRVRELIGRGARFDRDADGTLLFGREGAHGRRRILHANGDATGAEMVRALAEAVRAAKHITVREHAYAGDLVMDGREEGRVLGILAHHEEPGKTVRTVWHRAPAVVLATGGFGQLYARTTNPAAVTGDGLAMAARAGARLADLEFVQFHPTALDMEPEQEGDPLPLVTEALRGEGAILVDDHGERFMVDLHPRAELAPRDIVARAIRRKQEDGRRVYLDATEAVGERFAARFPTVDAHCRRFGIDGARQLIPVTPAAHYSMGGIDVDTGGHASLAGLWVCGEASASGVHGANRLASNSLLEALVFGARVAASIRRATAPGRPRAGVVWRETLHEVASSVQATRARIRKLMWERAGLVRDRAGLEAALAELMVLTAEPGTETASLLTTGRCVVAAALAREESRGAHCRSDFPDALPELDRRMFWTYDPVGALPLVPADQKDATREKRTAIA